MVDLLEYQGIELFRKYRIPTPEGCVFSDLKQMTKCFTCERCKDAVIKAQIPSGKRGKSGGIIFSTKDHIQQAAKRLLHKRIKGFEVEKLLVEEKIEFEKEMYLSLTLSRKDKSIISVFSGQGGIDVEELARKHPDKIVKTPIDKKVRLKDRVLSTKIDSLIKKMYKLMKENDATLVEINPLVLHNDKLIALDSKIVIDNNAMFRHPDIKTGERLTKTELKARKRGIKYVELDGNIGIIGNGAGLVMATLDLVKHFKGEPANFLDVGGGADRKIMYDSLDICLQNRKVKGLFINIFGGITRTDEIAKGLIDYKKRHKLRKPVVVRLIGTNDAVAKELLEKNNIEMHDSIEKCAKRIISLTR